MTQQAVWNDYVSNGHAVREAFGEAIPELRGLELMQLVLDPAGDLAFTLDLGDLPSTIPRRWQENGFNRLQFRIRFAIGALSIRRNDDVGAWKVSVALQDKWLHVVSEDQAFELTASFVSAKLDL